MKTFQKTFSQVYDCSASWPDWTTCTKMFQEDDAKNKIKTLYILFTVAMLRFALLLEAASWIISRLNTFFIHAIHTVFCAHFANMPNIWKKKKQHTPRLHTKQWISAASSILANIVTALVPTFPNRIDERNLFEQKFLLWTHEVKQGGFQ